MKQKRVLWFLMSAGVHVVVLALLLQALLEPRFFVTLFGTRQDPLRPEKIVYVTPRPASPAPAPPAPPRQEAPAIIPVEIPPVTATLPVVVDTTPVRSAVVTNDTTGTGSSGTVTGDPPTRRDLRIWGPPTLRGGPPAEPPTRTGIDGIRHSIDSVWQARTDSIAKLRDPHDWTIGEGKGKVGIDPKWLYLGPVKLPTALLAFLPLRVQANPNMVENQRRLGSMAEEVRMLGQVQATQRNEMKAINDRLNRERAARIAAQAAAAKGGGSGGGSGSSGALPPP